MDIVINLKEEMIDKFMAEFDRDWYVDKGIIIDAIKNKFSFNIIHIPSGSKIDFFILRTEEHNLTEFSGRKREKFDEKRYAVFCSVEDVIIKKLDYYFEGKSEKHIEDIKGILKIYSGEIDFEYINKWVKDRGTLEIVGFIF